MYISISFITIDWKEKQSFSLSNVGAIEYVLLDMYSLVYNLLIRELFVLA